jgi:hypothetical protein
LKVYDGTLGTWVFANLEFRPKIKRNDCCVRDFLCSNNHWFTPITGPAVPDDNPRETHWGGVWREDDVMRWGEAPQEDATGTWHESHGDVVCDSREGMSLRTGDPAGRTPTVCCERTGMCQNNTNATAHPDVSCFNYLCNGINKSHTPPEQLGRTTTECCLAEPEP